MHFVAGDFQDCLRKQRPISQVSVFRPQVLTSGPSSSIEILTTLHPRPSSAAHHVVETSTAPLHQGCSSLAGLCLADSLLRRRQRDRQASRRALRPRWHLCHCTGTSPRRFLPKSKGSLGLHRKPSSSQLARTRNRFHGETKQRWRTNRRANLLRHFDASIVHGRCQDLFPRADWRCAQQVGWTFGQGYQVGVNPRGADAERCRQEPGCR